MTDEEKTDYLIELYITAKRLFYGKPFLRKPIPGSQAYESLNKVREKLDELGAEYSEYLHCQFKAFKYFHVFPFPQMLCTDKAVKRYKRFKAYDNKNTISIATPLYVIQNDDFTVVRTNKKYSVSKQVALPIAEDQDANLALLAISEGQEIDERNRERISECLCYLVAKMVFLKKPVPQRAKEILQNLCNKKDGTWKQ